MIQLTTTQRIVTAILSMVVIIAAYYFAPGSVAVVTSMAVALFNHLLEQKSQ